MAFEHDGKQFLVGQEFDAIPLVAAMLRYQNKAEFAEPREHDEQPTKRRYKRRDMVPER